MNPKRWLYLAHRWLGIALCLFMAMWFFSGVVMMYVGYPRLTPAERLEHLPALALPAGCCVEPARAAQLAGAGTRASPDVRLAMVGPRPFWLVSIEGRALAAVDAGTGEAPHGFGATHALDAALAFAPGSLPRFVETRDEDIYTVSRALDAHRPLHRVALEDAQGTELYVSSRTGEVVRDSTRAERGWNWAGAILHWLYPLKGEVLGPWRRDVIIYASLACTILAVAGLAVGVLRWRFRGRFKSGARTPYRERWMRWHHIAGMAFGLVTATWIASGLLSMNPWHLFDSGGPRPDPAAYAGTTLGEARFAVSAQEAIARAGFPVRELAVRLLGGRTYYVALGAGGASRIVPADDATAQAFDVFPKAALLAAAQRLIPGHAPIRVELLDRHDNYYYARRPHTMTGHVERKLPVYRVAYDDPAATWTHLDPRTGAIHSRLDARGRVKRWAFAFLHSFDGWGWSESRPAWDIAMVLLSLGGFALCATGVVVGWRRLGRSLGAPAPESPLRGSPANPMFSRGKLAKGRGAML